MRLVLLGCHLYEYIYPTFSLVRTLCFFIVNLNYTQAIYLYIDIYVPQYQEGSSDESNIFLHRQIHWLLRKGRWGWGVFHSHGLSRGISTLNRVDIAHRLFSWRILVSMRKFTQHGGYELSVCVVWRCWWTSEITGLGCKPRLIISPLWFEATDPVSSDAERSGLWSAS